MLMRSRSHSHVRVALMVMLMIVASLRQVCGSYGRIVGNGALEILHNRRQGQDKRLALSPLKVHKPVVDPDVLFPQLDEFDQFGDAKESVPVLDRGYIWGFGRKPNPAQKLGKEEKKKLEYWLNSYHDNKVGDGAQGNQEIDDLITVPVMKNFNEKKHQQQQLDQRHRQMEDFQNAAADLAFDRIKNIQKERAKDAKTVHLPVYPPAKNSLVKIASKKPSDGKIHLLYKAQGQKHPPCSPATRRPGTCPATTFWPPTTRTSDTKKCFPKPMAKCKHTKGKKKKPQLSASSAKSLEEKIMAMKQHALSILKNLNYLEMEVLSQSPDSCHRHKVQGKCKGAIPKQKTKTCERLDRPTQPYRAQSKLHRGFFFGIRPASAYERLADLSAAREEELKLQEKVWHEHLQHLMVRKRPILKTKRYEAAPAAAARLEPVANKQFHLNSLSVILKSPRPTSASEAHFSPAQPDESPGVQSGATAAKKFANRNYELMPKKLNCANRIHARRKKKRRKKKMMLALRSDDSPMRN